MTLQRKLGLFTVLAIVMGDMIGSGIFMINPPYGLEIEAKRLSARYATL